MDDSAFQPDRPLCVRGATSVPWLAAFAALLFGIKLWFIGEYGNATPFWDQWDAEAARLYKPLVEGRLEWRSLFVPHVVHRIFTFRLLALGLFSANGAWNPLLQMVVNAALWVGTLCTLAVLFDRATGRRHLPLLLGFSLVAFGLPYGNENMLAGFQGAFYLFIFWSTLALWALAGAPPFAAGWWAGIGCGLLGFLSLGSGAFIAGAAAAVAVVQYTTGVRRGKLQLASIGVLGALFVCGILLVPRDPSVNQLGAKSVADALRAWTHTASWPLKIGVVGVVVAQWPAIMLAAAIMRRPPPAGDARWFLLAAAAGALGQTAAIAYGRATGSLASRYQDLFVVGTAVNFACALAIYPTFAPRGRGRAVAAVVSWMCVMLGALALHTHRHAWAEMEFRRATAAAQQTHTRAYVLTGNIDHLEGKPRLHVPYPEPGRLATRLDDPVIRSFLPTVIAPPLPATAFASDPVEAFVEEGTAPGLPAREDQVWSSHGDTGAEATGTATLSFAEPHGGYAVELPVACGGDVHGITIEVEQDGERSPVAVPLVTGAWAPARIKVRGRPFTLHVADRTPMGWIAVGSPVIQGRFDRHVVRLLTHWDEFVVAGALLALGLLATLSLNREAA